MPEDSGMFDPLSDEAEREWKESNPGPYHKEGAYDCVPDKPEVSPDMPEFALSDHPLARYVTDCLHGAYTIAPKGSQVHRVANGMPDGKGDTFDVICIDHPELCVRGIPATDYQAAVKALIRAEGGEEHDTQQR